MAVGYSPLAFSNKSPGNTHQVPPLVLGLGSAVLHFRVLGIQLIGNLSSLQVRVGLLRPLALLRAEQQAIIGLYSLDQSLLLVDRPRAGWHYLMRIAFNEGLLRW